MFRNISSFIKINKWRYVSTKINTPLIQAAGKEKIKKQDATSMRYNVCREHVLPKQKFVFGNEAAKNESVADNKETEQDKKQQEAVKNVLPEFPTGKQISPFTPSSTRRSVVLPLKTSKLANPFPEPVKFFPSATVSDEEKARQMQDKFPVPRSIKKAPKRN